jgi:hypothetical protein
MPTLFEPGKPKACRIEKQQYTTQTAYTVFHSGKP